MVGKIFVVVIALAALLFSFGYLYQNLPQDPVSMAKTSMDAEPTSWVDYGSTPVFGENLRFNHNAISYFIADSCSDKRRESMTKAFRAFSEEMKIITFYRTLESEADILVGCSDDFISMGENLFAAGEGGPSKIINSSQFKLIQEGKISLYEDSRCNYPVVEIHELGHVFGFDHSPNPASSMYNTSNCDQRMTQDMISIINNLYSIEPLPNAKITSLVAVKKGKYLDFNISITNEGLLDIGNISLTILSGEDVIDEISLDEIGVGYERTLRAKNVRLPSSSVKVIDFVLDKDNLVKELDESDNTIQMAVAQ